MNPSQAHLPAWVWVGAATLACIAGMVNAVGYLGFEHQAVSHMSGTTTLLGIALAQGDWRSVAGLWGVLIAFSLGAMLSGLIIQDSTLRLDRRYGVALTLEALLLLAAIPLFMRAQVWGAMLAAMACGLQNAMVTTYSGAVVRTSHVSGMFTDLGIGLGHALRGMRLPVRRLTLSGVVITSFLAGGVLGAWLFNALHYLSLLIPAALTGLTGSGYVLYRHWALRRNPPSADTHPQASGKA
ncbi:MAG: YoaK family protein [Pseudoxanthomonas sp.]